MSDDGTFDHRREKKGIMKTSVFDKLRKAEDSPAWNRASANVILDKNQQGAATMVGKILVKHPKDGMGPLEVFLWDWTNIQTNRGVQEGRASGCGYDKLSAAMADMKFGSITIQENDWLGSIVKAGYQVRQVL